MNFSTFEDDYVETNEGILPCLLHLYVKEINLFNQSFSLKNMQSMRVVLHRPNNNTAFLEEIIRLKVWI